jgi:hypothetical protein
MELLEKKTAKLKIYLWSIDLEKNYTYTNKREKIYEDVHRVA